MPLRRGPILAAVCLCAFAVNLDVTLVNVTLPRLVGDLGATTRELQWVVDAYTLAFAALVLAAGNLGDRLGRRRTLLSGLAVYGVGNALGAVTTTTDALIATRALMGVGAAIIFPTTLSIITDVFRDRSARARAIGLWGAVTGLAIALGPIAGGVLLDAFSWQATFAAKVPVAVLGAALVLWCVPDSRDPQPRALDLAGLVLSTLAIGVIVFALIEAPEHGWGSATTLGLLAAGAVILAGFVLVERRVREPMLDVGLFRNGRFSAASASVAFSFFALAGFIFLITQYFQFLRGYGPLETGVRLLPVASSVAIGSVLGTLLALRRGSKLIVGCGLGLLACAYAWVSSVSLETSYLEIAGQMIVLGTGMGLTSAPATESIMGAVDRHRAGVGSAVNDATRELGGTLGVAVIGSIFASLYASALSERAATELPATALTQARDSIGAALTASQGLQRISPEGADRLRDLATGGFFDGLQAGCLVACAVCVAGAAFALVALPSQPVAHESEAPLEPLVAGYPA